MKKTIAALAFLLASSPAWADSMGELQAAAEASRSAAVTYRPENAWSGASSAFREEGKAAPTHAAFRPDGRKKTQAKPARDLGVRRAEPRPPAAPPAPAEKKNRHWLRRIATAMLGVGMLAAGVAAVAGGPIGAMVGWGVIAGGVGLLAYAMLGDTEGAEGLGAASVGIAFCAIGALGVAFPGWGVLACGALLLSAGWGPIASAFEDKNR